jgi:hypothetical protein
MKMNQRSPMWGFLLATVLLVAGTLCGELTRGLVSQAVAPALLVLGIGGLSYLSLTSSRPAEGAESTNRVTSSR